MVKVNLDALIEREDFELDDNINSGTKRERISISDLQPDSFFFPSVRKPDFQRETNEWDKLRVCKFIKSFIVGDLIPAVILWRSKGGYLFVIDGSHRLSALSAWVNNDYGDGEKSKLFYEGVIPDEQIKIAEETRKLVNKKIGSYRDFRLALTHPDKVKPEIVKYAKNLGALAIQIQWVEGDVSKAEESFFNINQQAAPIDKTELELLKSRKKPNSIAARAIIRSGTGHKYWSCFTNDKQCQIEDIAKEIHEILFNPKLQTPIKTLDVPVCGKLYSSQNLSLVLNFVNLANGFGFSNKDMDDDLIGEETIKILKNVRKIARRFNGNHPSSLGLHPIIYCYSKSSGRYRAVSFLATVDFLIELERKKKFNDFIKVRKTFEEFLIEQDELSKQFLSKYRSVQKSYKHISKLFQEIVNYLNAVQTIDEALNHLASSDNFRWLNFDTPIVPANELTKKNFTTDQKSEIYIKEALLNAPQCKICNGFIHKNSISIDHIKRKQDGGLATIDNGQITHPYCNSTYKN